MTDTMLQKPAPGDLSYAVEIGDVVGVKALLRRGADANEREDGCSVLYAAVGFGYVEIARLLIKADADIQYRDSDGMTLLMKAAFNGDPKMVHFLLTTDVDVHAVDNSNATALHYAVLYVRHHSVHDEHLKVMRLLIDKNIDVSACDDDGYTARTLANANDHMDMVEILKEAEEIQRPLRIAAKAAADSHAAASQSQLNLTASAPSYMIRKRVQP